MTRASCSFAFSNSLRGDGRALRLRVQLHFGAQHVDPGNDAALLEVDRLVVERVGGLLLRARGVGARRRGQRLNVESWRRRG